MVANLFTLKVPAEKANWRFLQVRDQPAYTAGRQLLEEVANDLVDVDGNFVEQFQTGGFSARLFELALLGYLLEEDCLIDRSNPIPDFLVGDAVRLAIEATTSNPPDGVPDNTKLPASWPQPDDGLEETEEFVFQVAKALRRKLLHRDAAGRAYWEQPHLQGVPFVIAVQAFHDAKSLFHSSSPIAEYLYGRKDFASFDDAGTLSLTAEAVVQHTKSGGKVIPSGLFAWPEARHLSGVLFTNSATISKFNRIGTEFGYGPPDVVMIRKGIIADPSSNAVVPRLFQYVVGYYPPSEYESFGEGLELFHNPWAEIPIPLGTLPRITEHQLREDGLLLTQGHQIVPFLSRTQIFHGEGARQAREQLQEIGTHRLPPWDRPN